ncbi:unnamed protein product [Polarella glacialis]|uniref:Uncharacterized protein n=1 Tax=Polarella glacialis TaxID=89957 RepID=A0A813GA23_POLGL|nr:unnamed protein product [Polarella glacialis]
MYVKVKAVKTAEACNSHLNSHLKAGRARVLYLKDGASKKIQMSKERAKVKIDQATTFAKVTACDVFEGATSTRAGVTSTAAVAGGGVGFVAGGAVGAVAGATVGLVPALLTFGLSIPIGATIGLCAGVAAGGSAGVVGGGATGFTGFTYRKEIASSASYMRTKAIEKAVHVRQSVKSIIGSGTGGTV